MSMPRSGCKIGSAKLGENEEGICTYVGLQEQIASDFPELQPGENIIKVFAGKGQGRAHALFNLDTNLVHVKVAPYSRAQLLHPERVNKRRLLSSPVLDL